MTLANPLRRRNGIVLCIILAVGLVFVGCITIPLGDPEKSTVDQSLLGVWLSPATDGEQQMFAVQQYDSRTCFVNEFDFKKDGDAIKTSGRFDWKMWLTDVKGTTFACTEMKNPQMALGEEKERFGVARLVKAGGNISIQGIDDDFVKNAKITTSQQLYDLIAANLNNGKLFGDKEPMVLTKMTDDQKDLVNKVFDAFSGGDHGGMK